MTYFSKAFVHYFTLYDLSVRTLLHGLRMKFNQKVYRRIKYTMYKIKINST